MGFLTITSLYLGIFGLLYAVLSMFVITQRWKFKIGIGSGENIEMTKAIRMHGNFSEYVPFILFMMFCLEMRGTSVSKLHFIGATLLLSRLSHLLGLSRSVGLSMARTIGVVGTFTALIAASILLLLKI